MIYYYQARLCETLVRALSNTAVINHFKTHLRRSCALCTAEYLNQSNGFEPKKLWLFHEKYTSP